ncbi:hypothetical protein AB0C29_41900 [Actinoplanes sp. NPDC048791]|uniref:hypothetical protein n=1 Tax=Actinoplanes sp. NPDC048791 TaxID=3154623 RepID=UPI0034077A12
MRWTAPIGLAVLLAGAGVFFAVQDLGRADQYASVGSFLLALAVAGGSVALHLRHRGDAPSPEVPVGQAPAAGDPPTHNTIVDAGVVFAGPGARADITITPDGRRLRRKK